MKHFAVHLLKTFVKAVTANTVEPLYNGHIGAGQFQIEKYDG